MSGHEEPLLVSGNGAPLPRAAGNRLVLSYLPEYEGRRIRVGLPSFVTDLLHIPVRTLDLLEIAAYVFAADRWVPRGRADAIEYAAWSRSFDFHIRVRDCDFWKTENVRRALKDAIAFMTGDGEVNFHFYPGHSTPPANLFDRAGFSLGPLDEKPTLALFSGGIDSLAGALDCLAQAPGKLLLISHQSQPGRTRTQRALAQALVAMYPGRVVHYEFECKLREIRAAEETQRTRPFLYTAIAYGIASAYGQEEFFVHENGVTSINLYRREDLANARASRTTHPRTIALLGRVFSLAAEKEITIHLPYLFLTKCEVVQRLCERASHLLASTVSCARTFKVEGQATHCGACFQCVDRRIATYAAGVGELDHRGLYVHDLASESIMDRAGRTTAVDYVRQAKNFREWGLDKFAEVYFSDLADLIDFIPGGQSDAEGVQKLWELVHRHGERVGEGLQKMMAPQMDALQAFPPNSLLALVSAGEHLKPEVRRLADSVKRILQQAVGEMFSEHGPKNERDLNRKIAALLKTHEAGLRSEHPTKSFACARVIPDHMIEATDLLVEAKYIRGRTPPSKVSEGVAADLTKYPETAFILFVVFDPGHAISSDGEFCRDIEAKGRNSVLIIR